MARRARAGEYEHIEDRLAIIRTLNQMAYHASMLRDAPPHAGLLDLSELDMDIERYTVVALENYDDVQARRVLEQTMSWLMRSDEERLEVLMARLKVSMPPAKYKLAEDVMNEVAAQRVFKELTK